jgi:hypothetical protein
LAKFQENKSSQFKREEEEEEEEKSAIFFTNFLYVGLLLLLDMLK